MKSHFNKKMITAAIFTIFLFAFSFQNIKLSYEPIKQSLQSSEFNFSSLKETITKLEKIINETVYGKYKFIEAYGYAQALMGKNEESNFEVVKDTEGKLHFTYFANKPNPTGDLTARVKALGDRMNNKDTKLTYVMTPDKYIRGYTKFPQGIPYHYNNETADQFLLELQQEGVKTVDLREGITEGGILPIELFFKTDHHWKIETAFWGFGQFVKRLNEIYALRLDQDNYYTNINNYNVIKYEDTYIGSMGRKTGKYYSGVDDFTLIYPKFKTDYEFYFNNNYEEGTLKGRFEDALLAINPLRVKGDEYGLERDKYFSYLYGNQAFVHITNKDNPKGLKVLFIKDSLSVPLISFFSTLASDVYIIDPRYYKDDILAFVNRSELDHVFISYSPQNLVKEFFPFATE